MIIAVPMVEDQLCLHFGHCEKFAFFDVDTTEKTIKGVKLLVPPPHEPGLFPVWVREQGAELVITGGMGGHAQQLFQSAGVQVLTGAPAIKPEEVVKSFLQSTLKLSDNTCDH
ncbi:MAG TPA: NifB/NifX family molybdenum-iron cluster-binding protein [Oscillospiraceae bacterium]|nr:NifB/NifX family molybdenum-iron cluster-binding protein [Oscillospiraceae bacterium]